MNRLLVFLLDASGTLYANPMSKPFHVQVELFTEPQA